MMMKKLPLLMKNCSPTEAPLLRMDDMKKGLVIESVHVDDAQHAFFFFFFFFLAGKV
jgi:hypothetical protein